MKNGREQMQLIHRKTDIISNDKLNPLLSFKNFPVFMGCVDTPKEDDILTNMNWTIAENTGMVQINPIVDEKTIYMIPHGSGTVGKIWQDHHKQFAEFVLENSSNEILEIGSSHGILYNHLKDKDIQWTIVEPNYFGPSADNITVVPEFFHKTLHLNKKYSTIVHSHMLEHVLDIKEFFDGIENHIAENGSMIFSIPNLDHILSEGNNFVLHFEHTYLLRDVYVEYILSSYGFEIVKRTPYLNHSTFYHAKYKGNVVNQISVDGLYDEHKTKIINVYNHIKKDVEELNTKLQSSNGECFLFGGHVFSQYLLNLGLKEEYFSAILDNDKEKTGKRLYGSNLSVRLPDVIKDCQNPIIVLRASVYSEEIKKQLLYINDRCVFY